MLSTNISIFHLRRHVLPIVVWLAVLGCVVVLFHNRAERFEVVGIARGQVYQVSAPVDCQIKTISVELFDSVCKGQTLATLDKTQLNAQIDAIYAEAEHLKAQLVAVEDTMKAEAANLKSDKIAAQQRFLVDVENARIRILELKTLIETDKVTLEDLAIEVKIAQDLLAKDAVSPYELQKAQALHNALAKKIEENQNLFAQARNDLEESQKRSEEFATNQPVHPSINNALEMIRKQIVVQEKLAEELAVQLEKMTIICPADGVVIQMQVNANQVLSLRPGESLLRRSGEVVLAGDPILVVAETKPTEVVAYVGQNQLSGIAEQAMVQLVKTSEPKKIVNSQVLHLGPTMELMPQQLWQNSAIAQWGRPFLIKIPPGFDLLPGETVGIRKVGLKNL